MKEEVLLDRQRQEPVQQQGLGRRALFWGSLCAKGELCFTQTKVDETKEVSHNYWDVSSKRGLADACPKPEHRCSSHEQLPSVACRCVRRGS